MTWTLGSDSGRVLKTSRREERACKKVKWEGGGGRGKENIIVYFDCYMKRLVSM
jgi:hypothetical protein